MSEVIVMHDGLMTEMVIEMGEMERGCAHYNLGPVRLFVDLRSAVDGRLQ